MLNVLGNYIWKQDQLHVWTCITCTLFIEMGELNMLKIALTFFFKFHQNWRWASSICIYDHTKFESCYSVWILDNIRLLDGQTNGRSRAATKPAVTIGDAGTNIGFTISMGKHKVPSWENIYSHGILLFFSHLIWIAFHIFVEFLIGFHKF